MDTVYADATDPKLSPKEAAYLSPGQWPISVVLSPWRLKAREAGGILEPTAQEAV